MKGLYPLATTVARRVASRFLFLAYGISETGECPISFGETGLRFCSFAQGCIFSEADF
jgi:hypothetical protein